MRTSRPAPRIETAVVALSVLVAALLVAGALAWGVVKALKALEVVAGR